MFFFSSRRRHTRLQGDWSSDVCSSDLPDFLHRHTGFGAAARAAFRAAVFGEVADKTVHRRKVRGVDDLPAIARSEERRVGKECKLTNVTKSKKRKEDR